MQSRVVVQENQPRKCTHGTSDYEVTSGSIVYQGKSLLEMEVYVPADLASSSLPVPYRSWSTKGTFLRKSVNSIKGEHAPSAREFRKLLSDKMAMLDMDKSFLSRYVNDDFLGEKKAARNIAITIGTFANHP